MNKNPGALISPYYSDEEDQNVQAAITTGLSASGLPSQIIQVAQTSPSAEGEAVVGVVIIDASGTMEPNRDAVIQAMNLFREAIMKSHERRKMSLMVIFFDSEVRVWKPFLIKNDDRSFLTAVEGDPYCIPEFTRDIYDPTSMTCLYEAVLEGLASIDLLSKAIEEEQGADCRRVAIVVSDGFDNVSARGCLAQVCALVKARRLREDCVFIYYGLISSELREAIAEYLGIRVSTLTETERDELDQRIFSTVACGGDDKMQSAIKSVDSRTDLSNEGMGFLNNMVAVFPSDPDDIRKMLGVRMSSTFIKGSAGKINANQPIQTQVDPDPKTQTFV